MRPHLLAPVVALCLSLPLRLPAQETGTIRGRVSDAATGQPVPDARLTIEGTVVAAVSRANGEYLFPAVSVGRHTLVARRVGFVMTRQEVQVAAGQTVTADFALRAAALALDEVVVTGVGAPSELREVGNTISLVQGEAINLAAGATSIDAALQGKLTGAWISQNNGQPGAGVSIRLRGTNSINGGAEPLYVVDGVIVDNDAEALVSLSSNAGRGGAALANRLGDLAPADIERIEVLKGAAAAALYGSRANNGVIQIFTRRGRAGETRVSLQTEIGISRTPNRYELNGHPQAGQADVVWGGADSLGALVARYDLQDRIFRTGAAATTQLAISGGSAQTSYYFSGARTDQSGIVRPTEFTRTSVRASVGQQVNDRLDVRFTGNFIEAHREYIPEGEQTNGVLTTAIFTPTSWNFNFDQNLGRYPYSPVLASANPLLVMESFEAPEDVTRFLGSTEATWRPTSKLTLRYLYGIDDYREEVKYLQPPQSLSPTFTGSIQNPVRLSRQQNHDGTATYVTPLSPTLESSTTLGFRYATDFANIIRASASDLPPGQTTVGGATQFASQGIAELRTIGGFVEQRFSVRDQLYLNAGLNLEAASAFGPDERWQTFPRASVSYLLSETPFWQNGALGRTITTVRLRAAYGETGGQPPGAYSRFNNYGDVVFSGKPGLVASTLKGNDQLRPERQREIEGGFEAGLFDDRAVLDFTYYDKRTKDLVLGVPLPPSSGFQSQLQNVGVVRNRGWEATVTTVNVNKPSFSWRSVLSLSANRNKVEKLVNPGDTLVFGYLNAVMEGQPIGAFVGGIYARDAAGNIAYGQFVVSGETVLLPLRGRDTLLSGATPFARRVLGDPNPDLIAALSNSFTIGRNLELSVLLDGRFGNDVANFTRRITEFFGVDKVIEREITRDTFPGTYTLSPTGRIQIYEEYIEDGSFVKVREVAVRYRVDAPFVRSLGAESVYLRFAGRNLYTWTDYRGLDPEINLFTLNTVARGVDFANVPTPRSFTFGVYLNF